MPTEWSTRDMKRVTKQGAFRLAVVVVILSMVWSLG